jgi:hypothetical protein
MSCGEAGHDQFCRQAGEEASPDHDDSRDPSPNRKQLGRRVRIGAVRRFYRIDALGVERFDTADLDGDQKSHKSGDYYSPGVA